MTTNLKSNKDIPSVSIVIPAYNAEKYIRESIDSILNQSFTDFECIIVDDGSTDATPDIIDSYTDERIILLKNDHDFIRALNTGLQTARGKYIARMDADDIMHSDRIKIQYAIMEAEPMITVCSTWMYRIGEDIPTESILSSSSGLVEMPLLAFLRGNYLFHPTVMMRKEFLMNHCLQYEDYPYAEDLKLWTEIAKCGGQFYIENQFLLYYRISDLQVTQQKRCEMEQTVEKIQNEVLDYLIAQNKPDCPILETALVELRKMQQQEMISSSSVFELYQNIFFKNKSRLIMA